MTGNHVPGPPSNYGCITLSYDIPSWMLSVAYSVLSGKGEEDAVNGISYDKNGDLVLYRKPTAADRKNFPQLEGAVEVWVTIEQTSAFD